MFGGGLGNMFRKYWGRYLAGCLEDVGTCLEHVWESSGRLLESVRELCGNKQEHYQIPTHKLILTMLSKHVRYVL